MFTGIVQGKAIIDSINDHDALRTFEIEFPEGFCEGLAIGASVAIDGVCLTVTEIKSPTRACFDVMLQSVNITTLGSYAEKQCVNVERAAKDGAEIGGHPLSGHVDFFAEIDRVSIFEGNKVIRFKIPQQFMRYIFAKGYIAVNGCSLTIAEVNKQENWFEVWFIPETRRVTTFEEKVAGDIVNIEIERETQVKVDTIRDAVEETLGGLEPVLRKLLADSGYDIDQLVSPKVLTQK
jgi:riboflavin synthase